jgi:autotransporter-associated beta strand protein
MKALCSALLVLFLAPAFALAASMAIDSLSGPVTQNEINSFITYMQSQTPPPTPWGALNGTNGDHNAWADFAGGNALEAMGLMFEISGNLTILNQLVSWTDYCVSQRNDLMAATNGGQRVMWTGNIDKVWCPNEPTSTGATYAGGENGDTKAHIAYTALLILQNPALWSLTVPDGNPYDYGVTYLQRATNYVGKCDEANDEYDYVFVTSTNTIRDPPNWPSGFHTMEAINIQMMMMGDFQRLAQCHELLGDNPPRVARNDAIVKAAATECLLGMEHSYTTNGHLVYKWYYYPWDTTHIESVGHAAYDMVGLYRAFNRVKYGFTLSAVTPCANAEVYVMNLAANTFSGNVDGSGTTQNYMQAQWLLLADWNPSVYDITAAADFASGRYKSTTLMDATILWMKNRRLLQFSLTPVPASATLSAGAGTNFGVVIAPLGGFTNAVNLVVSGLPPGATANLSSPAVDLATLNFASTNVMFSVSTSNGTPTGSYQLNIIGTSGGVSHTGTVNLVVGSFSLSATPPAQTVSAGNSAAYTVTVTTNSGFSGGLSFGVSGLPANSSAGFSPGSLTGAGNSTLSVTTSSNTPGGTYTLTVTGTNGSVVGGTTVSLTIAGATPVWTGGSSGDSNWSDPANWGGNALASGSALIFNGTVRLNNTNDTAAATTYSNMVFTPGAGPFVLSGNSIALGGNITNNSVNPQAINLGLNFNGNLTFYGASNTLTVAGGLTNRFGAPGSTTLTLAGSGQLFNLLNSAVSPGGTNLLLLNSPGASWTLLDNSSSGAMVVPWVISVNNGEFSFGTESSAPVLTTTTINNVPQDNQVGAVSGATATFNMFNGTLITGARLNTATAANSTGILNQIGGILNIGSQFQGANGSNPGEVSIVNISGGTMNIGGGTGPFYVASRGTGTLTVGGSGVVSCGKLDLSRNAAGNSVSSSGTVNLDGGTLMATSVTNISANQQTGGSPTASFNFNGGTLVAKPGAAPMFFQGSLVMPVTPIATFVQAGGAVIDDSGNAITIAEPLQHDPALGGDADGGLTKLNTGTLTLTANSSYNGVTTVNAGTLALSGAGAIGNSAIITVAAGATFDASGTGGGTLALGAGQTLTGSGIVKGNVVVGSGATLAPGGSLTTMIFNNNLTLNAGSMTVMELSKAPTTNDTAQVAGNLAYGGTLVITNIGIGAFSAGDSFKLFNAAIYSGSFANLSPVIPAVNLGWDTNALTNGVLQVVSLPTPRPLLTIAAGAGNALIFRGSNGVAGWPYYLLASTNLLLPPGDWIPVATNFFDGTGAFQFTNTSGLNPPEQFFLLQLQ